MNLDQLTLQQCCDLPLLYRHILPEPLISSRQYRAMQQFLLDKLNNGGVGIVSGDSFIGKTVAAIDFVRKLSPVQFFLEGNAPAFYFYMLTGSTYKSCLIQIIQAYAPWSKDVKKTPKSLYSKTIDFLEFWARDLMKAAGTKMFLIDEPSHISERHLTKFLDFLMQQVGVNSIVLIGFTHIMEHLIKRPPYRQFQHCFVYEDMELSDAVEFALDYFRGTQFALFDWASPVAQLALASAEGSAGLLTRLLFQASHRYNSETSKFEAIAFSEFEESLEKKAYELRERRLPFSSKLVTSVLVQEAGTFEGALVLAVLRNLEYESIVKVGSLPMDDEEKWLIGRLALQALQGEAIDDYQRLPGQFLGMTAKRIALSVGWVREGKYTKSGFGVPDTAKVQRVLNHLVTRGLVVTRPGETPMKYMTSFVGSSLQKQIAERMLGLDEV
ncbi:MULTISPECIES: hypothetical protein [unclassified Leptolyngbya]|uniref:hypothetical protein n=1 Tax=unclassified Leptolyngbya TaxID=2650499 RepID=UPI003D322381